MKTIPYLILLLATFNLHGESMTALTKSGKTVILHDDGRWEFKPTSEAKKSDEVQSFSKDEKSTCSLRNKRDKYSIHYNPEIWERIKSDEGGDIEFFFQMKDEDGYGMTIYERIPIPLEKLKWIALENMKGASEGASIVDEEYRNVNGKEILYLKMEATMEGMPFIYRGYYSSGDFGTLQFITYTHKLLEEEYSSSMDSLLNGLVFAE